MSVMSVQSLVAKVGFGLAEFTASPATAEQPKLTFPCLLLLSVCQNQPHHMEGSCLKCDAFSPWSTEMPPGYKQTYMCVIDFNINQTALSPNMHLLLLLIIETIQSKSG